MCKRELTAKDHSFSWLLTISTNSFEQIIHMNNIDKKPIRFWSRSIWSKKIVYIFDILWNISSWSFCCIIRTSAYIRLGIFTRYYEQTDALIEHQPFADSIFAYFTRVWYVPLLLYNPSRKLMRFHWKKTDFLMKWFGRQCVWIWKKYDYSIQEDELKAVSTLLNSFVWSKLDLYHADGFSVNSTNFNTLYTKTIFFPMKNRSQSKWEVHKSRVTPVHNRIIDAKIEKYSSKLFRFVNEYYHWTKIPHKMVISKWLKQMHGMDFYRSLNKYQWIGCTSNQKRLPDIALKRSKN